MAIMAGLAAAAPYLISGGANILGGLIGGRKKDNFLEDHNKARIEMGTNALTALEDFYKTGRLGQYQAGEPYSGSLGDFNLTNLQQMSLDQLTGLLGSGLPQTYETGRNALSDFVNTGYDPATSDLYKGFRTGAMREANEAQDALRRNLAVTGDLYSTENARQSGLLQERLGLGLQNKLAELADTNVQRRLGAASDLTQLGLQEEDLLAKRIGLGMSLGDIERQLRTQEAQAKYNEFKRQRSEWYDTVNAAKQIAGVGGVSTGQGGGSSDDPFTGLLNTGLQLAGRGVGKFINSFGNKSGGNIEPFMQVFSADTSFLN